MKEQADIPFNVWERAEALAMAVRLHVNRKAPEQIENLLGTSVMKIVYMATCMMVNRDKGFAPMAKMLFSHDVQSDLCMLVFRSISAGNVETSNPKAMLNMFIKTAQNRIRNIKRNMDRRLRITQIIPESRMCIKDVDSVAGMVSDLEGKKINTEPGAVNGYKSR